MTTTLTDPKRLEELAKGVEGTDYPASLKAFIQSLSLPPGEESPAMDSLEMLPHQIVPPSALPKNPPNLMGHQFWM